MVLGPDIEAPDTSLLDPQQRALALRSLSVLGILSVAGVVGLASSLYLVNHYPLLLIALSPIGRHLILAAPNVHPVSFLVVGTLRRGAFYLASFQLGQALGPSGVPWLEQRAARFAGVLRWLESWFLKAPRLVVLLFVGPTVSALAGMSGMRRSTYLPLALVSLVGRLLIILAFGEVLREPIEWVLAWVDRYWVPGTVVMVLLILSYQWWRKRS